MTYLLLYLISKYMERLLVVACTHHNSPIKHKRKEQKFLKQKQLTLNIIKSVEDLPFMSKNMPYDGASFYHYTMMKASLQQQRELGIRWIVVAAKSSRRVMA